MITKKKKTHCGIKNDMAKFVLPLHPVLIYIMHLKFGHKLMCYYMPFHSNSYAYLDCYIHVAPFSLLQVCLSSYLVAISEF